MKHYFLASFLIFSFSALAEEGFSYPVVDATQELKEAMLGQSESLICELHKEPELKDSTSSQCQLTLGWGHTGHVKEALDGKGVCGIAQGCNEGDGRMGKMKNHNGYSRFQHGTNGTYHNYEWQGTQNGGLNPVIFETDDYDAMESVFNKNSYVGFTRMTQYHWLKLHQFANDNLIGKKCSEVSIKFFCSDNESEWGDLNNSELKKRLNAWRKPVAIKNNPELRKKYRKEVSLLNDMEPLFGCFSKTTEPDALPTKCGEKIIINANTKMSKQCEEWMNTISKIPQHNDNTENNLPRKQNYIFPSGTIVE